MLLQACLHLKSAGAAAIVLCANTMHLIADRLQQELDIPLIHIATATAEAIAKTNIKKVGLLGTKFTMELDFFRSKLADKNIATIIPEPDDRDFIHHTIFEELGRGLLIESTKQRYLSIIQKLIANGADGIVLGCTEIPLLIQPAEVTVPLFDTTQIHARAAVDFSLASA